MAKKILSQKMRNSLKLMKKIYFWCIRFFAKWSLLCWKFSEFFFVSGSSAPWNPRYMGSFAPHTLQRGLSPRPRALLDWILIANWLPGNISKLFLIRFAKNCPNFLRIWVQSQPFLKKIKIGKLFYHRFQNIAHFFGIFFLPNSVIYFG